MLTLIIINLAVTAVLVGAVIRYDLLLRRGFRNQSPESPFLVYGATVRADLDKFNQKLQRLVDGIQEYQRNLLKRVDESRRELEQIAEAYRITAKAADAKDKELEEFHNGIFWTRNRQLLEGVIQTSDILRDPSEANFDLANKRLAASMAAAMIIKIGEDELVGRTIDDVGPGIRVVDDQTSSSDLAEVGKIHEVLEPGYWIRDINSETQQRCIRPALVRVFKEPGARMEHPPNAEPPDSELKGSDADHKDDRTIQKTAPPVNDVKPGDLS
jgi:hypothetical protein